MTTVAKFLAFDLECNERSDDSIHVRSVDVPGFHFICHPDEDPIEAMRPSLTLFLRHLLRACGIDAKIKHIAEQASIDDMTQAGKARSRPFIKKGAPKIRLVAELAYA